MKIGILTLPIGHNYGGILQNFALQHVLKQLGHKPITFAKGEYYPTLKYHVQKLLYKLHLYKYPIKHKQIKGRIIRSNIINWRFIVKKIHLTSPQIDFNNDISKILKLDAIIVGSDQVWRPDYYRNIEEMFLSFVSPDISIKRIFYGASFGGTDWKFTPSQTSICKDLIKQFNAISVRETDGIEMCRKYFEVKPICVLDPTLLVEKKVYEKLCKKVKKQREYICAYILDCNESIVERLNIIASEKGLELKIFSADSNCKLSVNEWLAMFRDASMVITDSFHGTVFSIIFQKEFYSIANQERGGSRFSSLLSQLGLINRLFNSVENIDFNTPSINWESVNNNLNKLKSSSLNFLNSALNN